MPKSKPHDIVGNLGVKEGIGPCRFILDGLDV